jgi:hypothetical protein
VFHSLGHAPECGFWPTLCQTHLDLLPARSLRHRVLRKLRWILLLHCLTSTLRIIAVKVSVM